MSDLEDRYYSMPEIMKYLGISRDTVLRWIATKGMPAHKIGKNWKFKLSEIDEWVKSGRAAEEKIQCNNGDKSVELLVYDETNSAFRKLNKSNYNDDIICGTVLLRREALPDISEYFHICGYVIIDKEEKCAYPIDIHKDRVVIFEGTYNCMPVPLKNKLIKHNIQELPDKIWSSFFFQWQFLCDFNAFENNGFFIKLCSNILGSHQKYKRFIELDISLFEPSSYSELCSFTRNILNLSNVDIYGFDYYKSFKYLIHSLVNGYHINFSDQEISSYFFQISKLVDERWKE